MRISRTVAALAVVTVAISLAAPVSAGTVYEPRRGEVLLEQRGEADELELTEAELDKARYRMGDRLVGIVAPAPGTVASDIGSPEQMVAAAQRRLAEVEAVSQVCTVTVNQPTAADCIDGFLDDHAAGVIIIGDHGDLTEATVPSRNVTIVGVGPSLLAEGSVTLDIDPLTQATEQGRASGVAMGPVAISRRGNALLLSGVKQGADDPVSAAAQDGLRQTAKRVKVSARVGPPAVRTVDDLEAVLAQLPPVRLAFGEGLELDQADALSLERLPAGIRLVAWRCSGPLLSLVDLGSRLRGCVARADDTAGEAAANVILDLQTGRDVPAFMELPVYVYRGTVPVGPGKVQLGRRVSGTTAVLTGDETALATTALSGGTVGLVVPTEPGQGELAAGRITRETLEAAIAELGASVEVCVSHRKTAIARRCVTDFTEAGVDAIMTVATGADMTSAMNAAVAAGIMVVGVNETRLGNSGAIYVIVNPRSVGRLNGRMAGAYSYAEWRDQPVEAIVINDRGADGQDFVSSSVERALIQANPAVMVVNRIGAKDAKAAAAAAAKIIKRYPSVRLLVGQNAFRVAAALGGKKNVNPELTIYTLACDPDIVDAIDIGVDTGGRMKGCVDREPEAAGELAARVLTKLAAGSTLPEVLEVPVSAYEPGA